MHDMTALKSSRRKDPIPVLKHQCLRRISDRRYELINPTKQGTLSFDVEQVREIVEMDSRLREGGSFTSIPAGYSEFAAAFNESSSGLERFATHIHVDGKLSVCTDGIPVVWENLLVKESSGLRSGSDDVAQFTQESSRIPTIDNELTIKIEDLPLDALSKYIHVSSGTTDALIKFWIERGAIEHDYASRLAKLAEKTIGEGEPSDLRNAIDGCRVEAARQAMAHNTLANQIAIDLESRCLKLQTTQKGFYQDVFSPIMKRLRQESPVDAESPREGISSEWKKEYKNIRRFLDTKRFGIVLKEHKSRHSISTLGDLKNSLESLHSNRTKDWEELYNSCERMEKDRSQLFKDVLSIYTKSLFQIQQSHDESYKMMVHTDDLFEPKDVVEAFSQAFRKDAQRPLPAIRRSLDQRPSGLSDSEKRLSFSRPPSVPAPRGMRKSLGGLPPGSSASHSTPENTVQEENKAPQFSSPDANTNSIRLYPTRPLEVGRSDTSRGKRPISMYIPTNPLSSPTPSGKLSRSNSSRPQSSRSESLPKASQVQSTATAQPATARTQVYGATDRRQLPVTPEPSSSRFRLQMTKLKFG